jgi:hypothetical protein
MEIAPTARQVHTGTGQGKRPHDGHSGQKKKRTARPCGNGFLDAKFFPVVERGKDGFRNWKQMDLDFKKSLENLCKLYKLEIPKDNGLLFPMNVANAFSQVNEQFSIIGSNLELAIMQGKGCPVSLSTIKTFDTRHTLYYLPIMPFYYLSLDKHRTETFGLLRDLLSLFYHAGVCHFSEDYLGSIYEMIGDWYYQDEGEFEKEEFNGAVAHLEDVKGFGLLTLTMLKEQTNLEDFEIQMAGFNPNSPAEDFLLEVCKKSLSLFLAYPNRKITDRLHASSSGLYDPDEYPISVSQYISFCWDYNDCVFDTVWETVNADLQERCQIDEPFALQDFSEPRETEYHDLGFEQGFFELLNELTDLLGDFRDEQYHEPVQQELSA